jgi:lipopolysaccharide/colanic/teichoic acid biosynthesis glycosyltransferase
VAGGLVPVLENSVRQNAAARFRWPWKLLRFGGRLGVVWLPLWALVGSSAAGRGVILVALPAFAWALSAEPFLRHTPRPLKVAQTAAMVGPGVIVSLIVLSVSMKQPLPSAATLAGTLVGISVVAAMLEAVFLRLGRRPRVVVVGSAPALRSLQDTIDSTGGASFDLVGTVHCNGSPERRVAQALEGIATAAYAGAEVVVIEDNAVADSAIAFVLDEDLPLRFIGYVDFLENAFWCLPMPFLSAKWFACLVHVRQLPEHPSKRVFDLLTASLGLLVAAPLFLLIALLVSLTPGPVIYRQTRIGRAGKPFTIYKFRTMILAAEPNGEALLAARYDSRVTGVGRILRGTHLDELPQLWNVLRGEMSIVGPRPERGELSGKLEATVPFWNRRLLRRPGVTGWAQLRCGYASDTEGMARKLSHDLWYVRHQSLRLDIALCLLTVKAACMDAVTELRHRSREASETLTRTASGLAGTTAAPDLLEDLQTELESAVAPLDSGRP